MDDLFRKAAKSALYEWGRDDGLEDLVSELWVWYLESKSVQDKLHKSDKPLARSLAKTQAINILTEAANADDLFNQRNKFSSDDVKTALLGNVVDLTLQEILPSAMGELEFSNYTYYESIKSRYLDNKIPKQGSDHVRLVRAVKQLTELINRTSIKKTKTSDTIDPGSRRSNDGYSDPTGDTAVKMIESGDDEIVLCAMTKDRRPVRWANGKPVNSSETTTLRKEFYA